MSTLSLGIITFYRTSVKNVLHIDSSAPSPVYLLPWSYSQSSMFMLKKSINILFAGLQLLPDSWKDFCHNWMIYSCLFQLILSELSSWLSVMSMCKLSDCQLHEYSFIVNFFYFGITNDWIELYSTYFALKIITSTWQRRGLNWEPFSWCSPPLPSEQTISVVYIFLNLGLEVLVSLSVSVCLSVSNVFFPIECQSFHTSVIVLIWLFIRLSVCFCCLCVSIFFSLSVSLCVTTFNSDDFAYLSFSDLLFFENLVILECPNNTKYLCQSIWFDLHAHSYVCHRSFRPFLNV